MIDELLNRTQSLQNAILTFSQIIPDGTYGKKAIALAWESMRLGWYMMRRDQVGIAEKTYYVRLAYEALLAELKRDSDD